MLAQVAVEKLEEEIAGIEDRIHEAFQAGDAETLGALRHRCEIALPAELILARKQSVKAQLVLCDVRQARASAQVPILRQQISDARKCVQEAKRALRAVQHKAQPVNATISSTRLKRFALKQELQELLEASAIR